MTMLVPCTPFYERLSSGGDTPASHPLLALIRLANFACETVQASWGVNAPTGTKATPRDKDCVRPTSPRVASPEPKSARVAC